MSRIESNCRPRDSIRDILSCGVDFLDIYIDIGWTGDETEPERAAVSDLIHDFSAVRIVAATESARSPASMRQLSRLVPASRMVLGLDYRGGELISQIATEHAWVELADQLNITGILVLDLQSVGTSRGVVTTEICRRVKRKMPAASILSGGGIRDADDVKQLIDAGCAGCLVATALM